MPMVLTRSASAVTPDEMAPIFGDTYKAALASLENAFS